MHVSKEFFFLLQSSDFIPFEEEKVLKSINVYFVKTKETSKVTVQRIDGISKTT